MTAATVPASTGFHIFRGRNATQFESLGDVLRNALLEFVQIFLRVEKRGGDGILQKSLAESFKFGNFGTVELHPRVLFLVEGVALLHEVFVLTADRRIGHESVDFLAHGADARLIQDGLAKFTGLEEQCGVLRYR